MYLFWGRGVHFKTPDILQGAFGCALGGHCGSSIADPPEIDSPDLWAASISPMLPLLSNLPPAPHIPSLGSSSPIFQFCG